MKNLARSGIEGGNQFIARCDLSHALYRNPPVFVKGRNAELWDAGGKRYLDFCAGFASVSLGHCNPELAREAYRLASTLDQTHSQLTAPCLELAEELAKSVGNGMKSFIDTGGSAAVESCLKFAYAATGKPGVLCFQGGFHGRNLGLLQLSRGSALKKFAGIAGGPRAFHSPYAYCYRCPYGRTPSECGMECASAAVRMLEENQREIGVVLVEPAQGSGGYVFPPNDFLKVLKEGCERTGALLAVDEIQMGVARTGSFWCFQHSGVVPDLVIAGKGLAGGLYPLNAVIGRGDIIDSVPPGLMYSSFNGNPVGCGIALKVLEIIRRDDLCRRSVRMGNNLAKRLRELKLRSVGSIEGKGLAVGVELIRPDGTPATEETKSVIEEGLARGILLKEGGPHRNRLVLSPPLTIQEKEIDEFCSSLSTTLEQVFNSARSV